MTAEAGRQSSMQPNPKMPSFDSYAVELQALEDYRNFSATTIQRFYRGWLTRTKHKRQIDAQLQQETAAAEAAITPRRLYEAARTIQDAWRRFNNKRIYHYYRDLIRFKEAGDPRQMLRSINAREAALIDPAAGLHIRFRLGGASFPPLIFYKIFTHRPVTDIGAFCPRNYAAEQQALVGQSPACVTSPSYMPDQAAYGPYGTNSNSTAHKQRCRQKQDGLELPVKLREYIKPDGTLGYRSTKGWYHREDKNGWRPIAERLLLDQEHQAALPATAAQRSGRSRKQRHIHRRHRLHVHGMAGMTDSVQEFGATNQQEHSCSSSSSSSWDGSGSDSRAGESEASNSGRSSPVFHYNPVVRREERARQLKQRRRQWLLKMYRAGMYAAAAKDISVNSSETHLQDSSKPAGDAAGDGRLLHGANTAAVSRRNLTEEEKVLQALEKQLLGSEAAGASSDFSAAGTGSGGAAPSNTDDWDVDELVELGLDAGMLAWSQKLDFDSYQQHWNSTAVTLGSSTLVPQNEKLLLQQLQWQMPA